MQSSSQFSPRKVLIVHAHPERTSVTAQLAAVACEALQAQGHEIMQSDLYGMGWKAVFDGRDFPCRANRQRLSFIEESGHAFAHACQTPDVEQEQRKILAADAVILLFPLWWYSMPAIMKGWVDRVWAFGLAMSPSPFARKTAGTIRTAMCWPTMLHRAGRG